MHRRPFNIFAKGELHQVLEDMFRKMETEITNQPDDYILNANETEFIKYLVSKYSIENLELRFDDVTASTYEKEIPAQQLPRGPFPVDPSRTFRRTVVKYHIPFVGDDLLLHYKPNPRISWTTQVTIEQDCVCFELVDLTGTSQEMRADANAALSNIEQQLNHVRDQVTSCNESLESKAHVSFQMRKEQILKRHDLLGNLGVPIRRREDFPEAFAIPTPQTRKKIQIARPLVTDKGYKPEPTLDQTTFHEILQVIHDVGKQFERMPSTYADKDEEALRDHILLVLEPRFEGSATGETFNKTGKTDILLRHKGSNVFIAECKFWKGAKHYLEALTQLLDYLTWRDSKAALVVFVQNKGFSPVLDKVETETPNHPNHLGFVSKKDETWLNYRLHIPDDRNREVKLAVLLFHIPIA